MTRQIVFGRSLHWFIFARMSGVASASSRLSNRRPVYVCVEEKIRERAVTVLQHRFPYIPVTDWDLLEEFEPNPEHDFGKMGEFIPYQENNA